MEIELNVEPLDLHIQRLAGNKYFKNQTLPEDHSISCLDWIKIKQLFSYRTTDNVVSEYEGRSRTHPFLLFRTALADGRYGDGVEPSK